MTRSGPALCAPGRRGLLRGCPGRGAPRRAGL